MNTGLSSESFRIWADQRRAFSQTRALHYGDIHIDLDTYRVTRAARPLHLGMTDYRMLCLFLEHPCEDLIAAAWTRGTNIRPHSVDVHIMRLRKALTAQGELDRIVTVRSAGYMLG